MPQLSSPPFGATFDSNPFSSSPSSKPQSPHKIDKRTLDFVAPSGSNRSSTSSLTSPANVHYNMRGGMAPIGFCSTPSPSNSLEAYLLLEAARSDRVIIRASTKSLETTGNRLADAVVVAVQDNLHKDVVLAFARQGYHILCEKPMAINPRDILEMERAVSEAGIIFGMGHVLRYSPYTKALTEVLRSGQLGELVNAVHVEPVGYYHFAHSYVRGNWAKEAEPSEETAQENYEQDDTSAIQKPAAECHEVIGE